MPLALITGASSGIGAATARHLAAEGYRLILVARSANKLADVRESVATAEVDVFALDASNGDAVLSMATEVLQRIGTPDVIVNSAGAGAWKRIEETTPDEAQEMMGAPYTAAFNVTHAFMQAMLDRRSGVIIHVGSPASLVPWPGSVGYAAARFALRGLNEALGADLHGSGLHSCHVVFGRVASPYFDTNDHAADRVPGIGALIRTLSAEECAQVIARTIRKPRREVYHPLMLRINRALFWLAPGLVRFALRKTGHRRSAV